MKHTLIIIAILVLFSFSAICMDGDPPVVTCVEVNDDLYSTQHYLSNERSDIILGVKFDGNDRGIAVLEWSFNGVLIDNFIVSKKIDGDVDWTIIANVTNNLYTDTIEDGLCDVRIDYKIETRDGSGILITSNVAWKIFTESQKPTLSILDSISIINNNKVVLGWEPSPSNDAVGTIIYRHDNVWIEIARVSGNLNTSFEYDPVNPCEVTKQYAITTIDGCGNESGNSYYDAPLSPILLHDINYEKCPARNSLSWERYPNPIHPIEKYQIWLSNSSDDTLVGETAPDKLYYNHTDIDNYTEYSYYIRAVFGGFTSSSCTKSVTTGNFIKPDSLYLANANVLHPNNNQIELTIDVDLIAPPDTCTWKIFRSEAGGEVLHLLDSIYPNQVDSTTYFYIDKIDDGITGYYNYSINVYDSCGAPALQSDTIKTIFLSLDEDQSNESTNYLTWNAFEGWDGDIEKYNIYRLLDDETTYTLIDSVYGTTKYPDDLTNHEQTMTKFSYWVQAIEGSGNNRKSNSNILTILRETTFYFPNAFRPNSNIYKIDKTHGSFINREFKPVTTGFGGSSYLLQVYNRWGQLIFESKNDDYTDGWDGTYNGEMSPQGTYVYKLVYTDVNNVKKEQQGSFTLID